MSDIDHRLSVYCQEGLNLAQVARIEKHSNYWIKNKLKELGLSLSTQFQGWRYQSDEYKTKLQQCVDDKLTLRQMSPILGYAECSIPMHIRYHKISYEAKRNKYPPLIKKQVVELIEQELTHKEIATRLESDEAIVAAYCIRHQICTEISRNRKRIASFTKETFEELIDKKMTIPQIAIHLNVSEGTANRLLRKYGLQAFYSTGSTDKSFPCEYLKKTLSQAGISFVSEYPPLQDRKYRIDIALVEAKIGIEVNGSFHYADRAHTTLSSYHQSRHDLIKAAGWELIEIPYKKVGNEEYVKELIERLRSTT